MIRDMQSAQAFPHPLRQMGAKGKAKVKHVIGKAKPKGKAKPTGKANVKGNADGQEQDQTQPQEPVSSSGAGSKGTLDGTASARPAHGQTLFAICQVPVEGLGGKRHPTNTLPHATL